VRKRLLLVIEVDPGGPVRDLSFGCGSAGKTRSRLHFADRSAVQDGQYCRAHN
jgi:hypothetical protein